MKGQVALITGASSGIGWAAAHAFAAEGMRLVLAARRQRELDALARTLPTEALAVAWDVADTAKAGKLVALAVERFGRLDTLVNNAGVMATRAFHEQDLSEVERVMRVNYLGAAALTQAALPAMLAQGRGHIVNVASLAGVMGMPFMAAYAASKWALVGLTESLRREYYGTGVTFTAFCPGSVDTPMVVDSLQDPELGRLARPKTAEQVARKLVKAVRERSPEVIYGDAPGFLVKIGKFIPGAVDWALHHTYARAHPLGHRRRPRR